MKVSIPEKNRCNSRLFPKLSRQVLSSEVGIIKFNIPQVRRVDRDNVVKLDAGKCC